MAINTYQKLLTMHGNFSVSWHPFDCGKHQIHLLSQVVRTTMIRCLEKPPKQTFLNPENHKQDPLLSSNLAMDISQIMQYSNYMYIYIYIPFIWDVPTAKFDYQRICSRVEISVSTIHTRARTSTLNCWKRDDFQQQNSVASSTSLGAKFDLVNHKVSSQVSMKWREG